VTGKLEALEGGKIERDLLTVEILVGTWSHDHLEGSDVDNKFVGNLFLLLRSAFFFFYFEIFILSLCYDKRIILTHVFLTGLSNARSEIMLCLQKAKYVHISLKTTICELAHVYFLCICALDITVLLLSFFPFDLNFLFLAWSVQDTPDL